MFISTKHINNKTEVPVKQKPKAKINILAGDIGFHPYLRTVKLQKLPPRPKPKQVTLEQPRNGSLTKKPLLRRKHSKNLYPFIDGVYRSYWVGRFIRLFIKDGKAATVERHMYDAFQELYLLDGVPGNEAVIQAMETIKPIFAIKRKRFSKRKMRYFPVILPPSRQFELALHSLKDEINKYWRQETEFDIRIIDILKNRAEYLKRRYEKRRKRTVFGKGGAVEHRQHARWTWRTRFK